MRRQVPQSSASTSSKNRVTWLPTLYTFDNDDRPRAFRAGYSTGMYYSETGLLYLKDGSPGTMTPRNKKVEQKQNTSNLLEAAKLLATQQWEKKQRMENYHPSDSPPEQDGAEEWNEMWGDNKYPAVSKNWEDCLERHADDLECSPEWPWYCQPKIDGVRNTVWYVDGEIVMYSRALKEWPFFDRIRKQCATILDFIADRWPELGDVGLDGEIWIPDLKHHQELMEIVGHKKTRSEDEYRLVFYIFDIMEYTLPFSQRHLIVDEIAAHFGTKLSNIDFVGTSYIIYNEDITTYFRMCADGGFTEGIVLRRGDLLYSKKKEHKHCAMVKLKKEEDGEYEVIGYKEGTGTQEGCVVWHLQDLDNEEVKFWSVMLGDVETRRWYFKHAKKYIGRLATVKYSELSKDGVPKMPIVTHFRDEADLPPRK